MKLLIVLLGLLDRVLQIIVAPVPNRVAYITYPDYTDNAWYVYRHALRTRNNLEHTWLVLDMGLRERIEREFQEAVHEAGTHGNVLRVVRRPTLAGYFLFLRSRIVFHTHGAYRFRNWAWRRQIVCLWHGMPIKCIGRLNRITPNPYPTFGTLHIATSHFFRDIIAAAFAVTPGAVKLCSLPRCDALRLSDGPATPRAAVRERLGLTGTQRLVLWLPTYRAETAASAGAARPRSFLDDLPPGALEALKQVAEMNAACIITKLHPFDFLNRSSLGWASDHVRLLRSPDWNASGIQLYDLIAASDALLSDVSSVLIDYSITSRPIGILGFDPATYTRELTFPIDKLLGTGRFDVLDDLPSISRFFGRLGEPRSTVNAGSFLYERFELTGSEQILRETGL